MPPLRHQDEAAKAGLGSHAQRRQAGPIPDHRIGSDWEGDVPKVLFAHINELSTDPASDLIVGARRDANAARFCNALKPRRNVHTIPKDVVRLDNYVADIDSYAERNAIVFGLIDCKFMNAGLELYRSSDRFNGARELRQEAIAGVLHDAATVLGDCWMDRIPHERG
jgi:hypothetical protein